MPITRMGVSHQHVDFKQPCSFQCKEDIITGSICMLLFPEMSFYCVPPKAFSLKVVCELSKRATPELSFELSK